jgi:hypothetical protein
VTQYPLGWEKSHSNDIYTLEGLDDVTPTTILAGAGNDAFNVQVTTTLTAPLLIDGGPGSDTLDLVDTQGTGLVRTIPKAGNPTSGEVTVTYPAGGPTVAVNYRNVEKVDAVSDVTSRVKTKMTSVRTISPTHNAFNLAVSNVSALDINGNVRILLQGFSAIAKLTRVTFGGKPLVIHFTASGDQYFSVPVGRLGVGKSLTVRLTFLKPLTHFNLTGTRVIRVFAESLGP